MWKFQSVNLHEDFSPSPFCPESSLISRCIIFKNIYSSFCTTKVERFTRKRGNGSLYMLPWSGSCFAMTSFSGETITHCPPHLFDGAELVHLVSTTTIFFLFWPALPFILFKDFRLDLVAYAISLIACWSVSYRVKSIPKT